MLRHVIPEKFGYVPLFLLENSAELSANSTFCDIEWRDIVEPLLPTPALLWDRIRTQDWQLPTWTSMKTQFMQMEVPYDQGGTLAALGAWAGGFFNTTFGVRNKLGDRGRAQPFNQVHLLRAIGAPPLPAGAQARLAVAVEAFIGLTIITNQSDQVGPLLAWCAMDNVDLDYESLRRHEESRVQLDNAARWEGEQDAMLYDFGR